MKKSPVKQGSEQGIVKTTMRMPRSLWNALRHRAVDEDTDLQTLVARAVEEYLKKGGQR